MIDDIGGLGDAGLSNTRYEYGVTRDGAGDVSDGSDGGVVTTTDSPDLDGADVSGGPEFRTTDTGTAGGSVSVTQAPLESDRFALIVGAAVVAWVLFR